MGWVTFAVLAQQFPPFFFFHLCCCWAPTASRAILFFFSARKILQAELETLLAKLFRNRRRRRRRRWITREWTRGWETAGRYIINPLFHNQSADSLSHLQNSHALLGTPFAICYSSPFFLSLLFLCTLFSFTAHSSSSSSLPSFRPFSHDFGETLYHPIPCPARHRPGPQSLVSFTSSLEWRVHKTLRLYASTPLRLFLLVLAVAKALARKRTFAHGNTHTQFYIFNRCCCCCCLHSLVEASSWAKGGNGGRGDTHTQIRGATFVRSFYF